MGRVPPPLILDAIKRRRAAGKAMEKSEVDWLLRQDRRFQRKFLRKAGTEQSAAAAVCGVLLVMVGTLVAMSVSAALLAAL